MIQHETPRPAARRIVRGVIAIALLLAIPAIAMQLSDEVRWDIEDFAAAAMLLAMLGLAIELLVSRMPSRRSRLIAVTIVLFAFLWLWAELAVGVFTNWGS